MLAEQLLQSAGLRIGDPLTLPLGVLCMRTGLQFVDPPARSGCRLSCRWTNFQIGYLSACVSALDKYVRIAKADKVPIWYVLSVVFANALALLRTPGNARQRSSAAWKRSSVLGSAPRPLTSAPRPPTSVPRPLTSSPRPLTSVPRPLTSAPNPARCMPSYTCSPDILTRQVRGE